MFAFVPKTYQNLMQKTAALKITMHLSILLIQRAAQTTNTQAAHLMNGRLDEYEKPASFKP